MTSRSSRAAASAWLALPLLASCVSGDYNQLRVYQPPPMESVAGMDPGMTDLATALDALGAPVYVIEVGLNMVLAWGWQATTDWNVDAFGPTGNARGRFRFSSTDERTNGLVLFFDPSWTLTSVHTGHLVDLLPRRHRPRDVEDDLLDDSPSEEAAE